MDFLDDTMHIDGQMDEEANESVSGFFSVGEPFRSAGHSEPEASESSEPSEPLFLPADEEDEEEEIVEIPNPNAKRPRPSPEASRSTKKRRVSPDTFVNTSSIAATNATLDPARKEPQIQSNGKFYIGEFLVDGAFSLVSGKNVVHTGQLVYLARDTLQGSNKASKESSEKKGGSSAKGKQTTLAGFITRPAAKPMKSATKVDHIVRFTAETGLHLGRLPVAIANWVGKLLDFGLAHFVGTVVEAAERIRTGDSILLSLQAYLTPEAFQKPAMTDEDDVTKLFHEASETETAQNLRERRASILKLFEMVGLRPRVSAAPLGSESMRNDAAKIASDQPTKPKTKVRREIIGEGEDAEEIEVSDDEECLDDHDLNTIYKK
jgi:DNA repair protein RAD5